MRRTRKWRFTVDPSLAGALPRAPIVAAATVVENREEDGIGIRKLNLLASWLENQGDSLSFMARLAERKDRSGIPFSPRSDILCGLPSVGHQSPMRYLVQSVIHQVVITMTGLDVRLLVPDFALR
ncbi:hypothetical protein HZH68_012211 [Vespula germanica]|uniref:Uncharacterized protein n=1 Tax=Vespula germanica TaxID=30212 RepID=A0A834JH70_VESGE|nr:hypothetical protein HZH68_012211 [Vespula germanica]